MTSSGLVSSSASISRREAWATGRHRAAWPARLQDLRQHGSRDLIGPVVGGRQSILAAVCCAGAVAPRHLRRGWKGLRLVLRKLGNHFVDAEKKELFPGWVNRPFMAILLGHAQSRYEHRIVQLHQGFSFKHRVTIACASGWSIASKRW